jgi:hypothetical protein
MGIGQVQGDTRVPPDHPEGGARDELYSKGLWETPNFEPRTSNLEQPGGATLKPVDRHPKAPFKPPGVFHVLLKNSASRFVGAGKLGMY